jgi:hypothetical protein
MPRRNRKKREGKRWIADDLLYENRVVENREERDREEKGVPRAPRSADPGIGPGPNGSVTSSGLWSAYCSLAQTGQPVQKLVTKTEQERQQQ